METVVMIIMMSVVLTFALKLSFHRLWAVGLLAGILAVFTFMVRDYAVTQSKTQIADWLANPELMLDIAVILTVDVMMQIAFCFMHARKSSGEKLPKTLEAVYQITFWLPGLLIFLVLGSVLVQAIFAMPGSDFTTTATTVAAAVLIALPALALGLKWLLPSTESRLELTFLVSILTAVLGIVATVNGRTASAGTTTVEWAALATIVGIAVVGGAAGLLYKKLKPLSNESF